MKKHRPKARQPSNRKTTANPLRHAAWEPLVEIPRAFHALEGDISGIVERYGVAPSQLAEVANELFADARLFVSHTYEVTVKPAPTGDGWKHLSIRRRDGGTYVPWADKQRIKDQLVGPECEGIELFPAQSRMLDLANVMHLFVCADPCERLEIGFHGGRNVA